MKLGFIGFGEVGFEMSQGFKAAGLEEIFVEIVSGSDKV